MSFFRQTIHQSLVILLVIILANAESDLTQNEETTVSNVEENSEGSTEVVPSELTGDMKRDQRSFLGDLWGDIFDDCECNNCNCNPGPLPNNALPNNLPNNYPNDYSNNYYYNRPRENFNRLPGLKPWKSWKALKKPWFGLFGDDCRGNCHNNQIHYHQGYNQGSNNNGYNNNGYNNNNNYNNENDYKPAPAHQKFEEPTADYEKPKYEEPAPVYEKPKYEEAAPVYEQPKYEEPEPAYEEPALVYEEPKYERPASVYKKPIHEISDKSYDCGSSSCPPQPQLVYQPIIYFGTPQAQLNQNSSEEQEDSKHEVENKHEENYEEQSNYENKHQSYEEHTENEEKKIEGSSEEDKDDKKEDKSHAVIPTAPVYVPCAHGCGGPVPYSYPAYNYPAPPSVPLHQVINYNGLVPNYVPMAPISSPAYYPTSPAFSPAPVSHGCGCGHQSYGPVFNHAVAPSHSHTHGSIPISSLPHSYGSLPSSSATHSHGSDSNHAHTHINQHHGSHHYESNHHGSHHYLRPAPILTPYDQPYRACPELFAAYNQQVAHLTSTNSLYK